VSEQLRDITDRADVERLVRAFYSRAMTDPMIGYLFTDIAHLDLEEHVPRITAFWETILLGAQTYTAGAFAPHASLHRLSPLRKAHFERWLMLWHSTVQELFDGPRAALAMVHADRVARAFHRRVQGLDFEDQATGSAPIQLTVTRHG
jgi:hemoglobin